MTATGRIERSDVGILSEAKDSEWDISNAGIIYEDYFNEGDRENLALFIVWTTASFSSTISSSSWI